MTLLSRRGWTLVLVNGCRSTTEEKKGPRTFLDPSLRYIEEGQYELHLESGTRKLVEEFENFQSEYNDGEVVSLMISTISSTIDVTGHKTSNVGRWTGNNKD